MELARSAPAGVVTGITDIPSKYSKHGLGEFEGI
jgi:hypothetical protein